MCDKERALIQAYKAAAELLGAAEGDLSLTPVVPKNQVSEEHGLRIEHALEARIKVMQRQLALVREKTKKVNEDKKKRILALDRMLFNARCGMELMQDLARTARRETCARAVEFMEMRLKAQTPSLVRMINDEFLVRNHTGQLAKADELLERHGGVPNLRASGPPLARPYVMAGAIH